MKHVTIVNTGVGNFGAIPNMLKRLGASAAITDDLDEIARADRLILPGVGAFDAAAGRLVELAPALARPTLERGVPILGLCLGMQLLANSSEEGNLPGLGWIPGRVVRFRLDDSDATLHVPQMGWNVIRIVRPTALLSDLGERPRFYFANSYHFVCDDPDDVAAISEYGYWFPAVIRHENVMGAQFHPEKSHRFGMKLLENFLGI
jgi:glutamine amidotransferase